MSPSDPSTRVSLIPDIRQSPRSCLHGVQDRCPILHGMGELRVHSWIPTQWCAVNLANRKYQREHGALGHEGLRALKHPKGPGFRNQKVLQG